MGCSSHCFGVAALMKPPIGMFIGVNTAKIALPSVSGGQPSPSTNLSSVAFCGAKVLVSCWKTAMAIRKVMSPLQSVMLRLGPSTQEQFLNEERTDEHQSETHS